MSAPRFAPGPWRVVPATGMYDDSTRIEDADGEKVVCVNADETIEIEDGAIAEILSPKANANARLIAAAPEMHHALEQAAKYLRGGAPVDMALDAIDYALAKAVTP